MKRTLLHHVRVRQANPYQPPGLQPEILRLARLLASRCASDTERETRLSQLKHTSRRR